MTDRVISEYRKGRRFLRLYHDGKGYGYEGTSCGGGFGWDGTYEAAMKEFARLVRLERVELAHVAGDTIPALVTDGLPMTTADFKRLFAQGTRWLRNNAIPVQVLQARSKDIVLALHDNPNAKSYLDYPKASRLRQMPNGTVHVLDGEGKPLLTYSPA